MTTNAVESGPYKKSSDRETQVRRGNGCTERRNGGARWTAAILVLGLVTYLPSLTTPLVLDDYLHASMVAGRFPAPRSPFDLYDFVSDADRSVLFERGLLPWWTHPHLTIRFLRPLSSVLLWLDHRLFAHHPILLHLPSFGWWAAGVLAARALYARVFGRRVTWIATAIFALGVWHAIPLAWLANCEALISLALGAFALGLYARWREEARPTLGLLAAGLFALAMLGGEYALCFGGYCFAIELGRRREGLVRCARGTLPFLVPAAAYLAARAALGYGVTGSGFYSDPLRDPWAFLDLAPWRFVALLFDGWVTVRADTWSPGVPRWVAAGVLAVMVAFAWVPIRQTLARLGPREREAATWLFVGSLLAMMPVLAVVPSARLLGVSALGISATVALLLDRAWFEASPEPSRTRELTATVAVLFGFAHLLHGPVSAWLTGLEVRRSAVDFLSQTLWLRNKIVDPASAEIIIVRAGGGMFFGPFAVDPGGQLPARWRTLSYTGHALLLRKGSRTLELVSPPDKSVYPAGAGNLFRSPWAPLRTGDEVAVPGMRARILETGLYGPTRVRFEFDRDLDSPDLIWTAEDTHGFRPAEPPKVGTGAPFDP
jgi:hypothetical protein